MKLVLQVELGNDAMESHWDAFDAIRKSLLPSGEAHLVPFETGESGSILDHNGNTVGMWKVHA